MQTTSTKFIKHKSKTEVLEIYGLWPETSNLYAITFSQLTSNTKNNLF